MRYTRYIVAFVALILAAACTISDIDDTPINVVGSKGSLQVVGRVTQYTDCDVATRSKKEGDEPKVTSMGLALFPIENGTIGNCVYYDFQLGGSIVFIVDRNNGVFKDKYENTKFAMYIFANMQDAEGFPQTSGEGVSKSLEYFTKCASAANVNVKDVPENGFPMIGSLGNTLNIEGIIGDGVELILKPKADGDNVDGLPLVGGTPTDNLEIPLKAMYAKFSFTITVEPDQEIVGNKAPRFDVLSYEVHNIPSTVDTNSSTNSTTDVIAESGDISVGNYAQGATDAEFDFYLPERYLTPATTAEAFTYPLGANGADVEGYSNIPDENQKYAQRYKPLLAQGYKAYNDATPSGKDSKATYVTIKGKYTDHQGHNYDVSYDIYLGADNYGDFNILRNTHYSNNITIRGISSSNDQVSNGSAISIDWRVDIDRSTPLVINLRRETLLDAHYEVRPMRLRLVGEDLPEGTSATVQVLNEDPTKSEIPDWIRLELSGNTGDYITTGVSAGKRKYFTTNLVTETLANNTRVTVNNLTGSNQTVWIYVDDNASTTARTAIVRVTYGGETKDYKIVQNGLYEVKVTCYDGVERKFYIEQYEEYLYNYDAEDSYGQTKEEGMQWGLNGVKLSNKYRSFNCDEGALNDWFDDNKDKIPYYDFYIGKHDSFASANGGTVRNYKGQEFTKEIAENSNADVKALTMADPASSAVEYCYNRNKRNANGTIAEIEWYLPAADELEEIIVKGYSSFKEFQENYYWTSQPAYIRNIFYYEYDYSYWNERMTIYTFDVYDDNTKSARATKVISLGNDKYDYIKSGLLNGLDEKPVDFDDDTKRYDSKCLDRGCFYMMYKWKRSESILGRESISFTEFKKGDGTAFGGDEEYDEKRNSNTSLGRYHVHLGHLSDMIQKTNDEHGYHDRTKKNRVRCVRVAPSN